MSFKALLTNQFIQAILFLLSLLFLWEIRKVLIILFIAFIIASSLHPITLRLQQRMPKFLALGLPYLAVVAILGLFLFLFIPLITNQTREFVINFPVYLEGITKTLHVQVNITDLRSFFLERLSAISSNVYSITTTVFGELITVFFTIFISIYFLADRDTIHNTLTKMTPGVKEKNKKLFEEVEQTLGAWARGQTILSAVIFFANFLAYLLIGIPFALPLALLAGLLEVVPTVGPIIAAIPAIIVALTISPLKATFVFVVYVLIQILEGNFLVPKIMEQAVGLHPIIVMVAILIGSELMGVAGALISIPFVSLLIVIWQKMKRPV